MVQQSRYQMAYWKGNRMALGMEYKESSFKTMAWCSNHCTKHPVDLQSIQLSAVALKGYKIRRSLKIVIAVPSTQRYWTHTKRDMVIQRLKRSYVHNRAIG